MKTRYTSDSNWVTFCCKQWTLFQINTTLIFSTEILCKKRVRSIIHTYILYKQKSPLESKNIYDKLKYINKVRVSKSTSKIRMSLSKPKPINLAITFLKRNLSPWNRLSSRNFDWSFSIRWWRRSINYIKRQRADSLLLLRGYSFVVVLP